MMKKWKVAAYVRLSSDDNINEESNSIKTQKNLIDYYLKDKKELELVNYYADDGFTGTDFNRPSYQKMIKDIQNKKVDTVIVKDLSRIGRNYIEVGKFLEEFIPCYNIRFISINDNIDSYKNHEFMNSIEIPFKNLMNESYSKDTSDKIRTALKTIKKKGCFTGKLAPYGYLKDPENDLEFIIDDDAAKTVKKIFDMVLKGYSRQKIADHLNFNNILTPSRYLYQRYRSDIIKISDKWNVRTIDNIIQNKSYFGCLVQGKRTRISHKTHNLVKVPGDEWIIIYNHHKPIIEENIFLQVNNILYNRNVRINNKGEFNKYGGYLKCGDCKSNLYKFSRTKKGKKKIFYYCGNYVKNKACTKHFINENDLDNCVLAVLNKHLELFANLYFSIEEILKVSKIEFNNQMKKLNLITIDKNIKDFENLIDEVSKDYEDELITKGDFEMFTREYLYELNKLRLEREEISNKKVFKDKSYFMKLRKAGKLTEISRNTLDEFIDNIFVYDDGNIKIDFKFQNEYDLVLEYLKNNQVVI